METAEKLCPVCKSKNEINALICIHCGAALGDDPQIPTVTALSPEASAEALPAAYIRSPVNEDLIPADSVALFVLGVDKTVYLHIESEVILGRKVQETDTSLLDLRELGGYQMGLSRRHAKIRRSAMGYELIDLSSTNGSWLNKERLIPEKPYPLTSGALVKLGHMSLYFFHRPVSDGPQT